MSGGEATLLAVILVAELVILRRGQRRALWGITSPRGWVGTRLLAYALAAPGTILHEGAHYLACLGLGVPVGRQLSAPDGRRVRTRWFWPQRTPEGDLVLGGVVHARTDPLRQALIATAPLILIPPALAVATALLLGQHALVGLPDALGRVPAWHAVLWCYLALSCGQAAFPSPGDRVGAIGALWLVVLTGSVAWLLVTLGGAGSLLDVLGAVVGVLAAPAAAASVLLVLGAVGGRRRHWS
ncbi:MAG TPA: hypothetical protein VGY97_08230 [Solirubrobacteraceae bacterium]|nr:hypothetical protein [Solirubrobacteraceae bacterium]